MKLGSVLGKISLHFQHDLRKKQHFRQNFAGSAQNHFAKPVVTERFQQDLISRNLKLGSAQDSDVLIVQWLNRWRGW